MRGHGEAARNGRGDSGDLYIEIEVESHEWFERDGSDLLMALPIGFADLLLGTTVKIPHIDGTEITVKIPSGSNPGDTISIPGRGLPRQGSRSRGRGFNGIETRPSIECLPCRQEENFRTLNIMLVT